MGEDDALAAAIAERIVLAPHDAAWAGVFEAERRRLVALRPHDFGAIEHVGSTAVPGLVAKPVVDLLAGVASMARADALVDVLCTCGYATSHAFNATLADRRWLMRWQGGHRTHHLHLVVHDSPTWHEHLAFRDALRRDADLAGRYAALKIRLAMAHAGDREAYTAAKGDFIRDALRAEPPA